MGGVERVERTPDGVQRIERVDDSFYVKHPLSNKGVIHFGIDLISPKPASPTQNDVTIYVSIAFILLSNNEKFIEVNAIDTFN
ncbi:unnamed protein product [Trichobilharzia regenti]|nr:unnamed protein product [Trichobilharzia regenti]